MTTAGHLPAVDDYKTFISTTPRTRSIARPLTIPARVRPPPPPRPAERDRAGGYVQELDWVSVVLWPVIVIITPCWVALTLWMLMPAGSCGTVYV